MNVPTQNIPSQSVSTKKIRTTDRMQGIKPYSTQTQSDTIRVKLDANEGRADLESVQTVVAGIDDQTIALYPSAQGLESKIAQRWGIEADRVVVTAGGDDAIARICQCFVDSGRRLLAHDPTFVMIPQYTRLAEGDIQSIPWLDTDFPVDAFVDAIDESIGLVAIVSPSNPTGRVAAVEDIIRVARKASEVGVMVMVDLAYVEFADQDPTALLLELPNVVLVRTFSKAYGLAGIRVGYAMIALELAPKLRAAGGPYPVSAVSVGIAEAAFDGSESQDDYLTSVRRERAELSSLLVQLGGQVIESQANFVLVAFEDAQEVANELNQKGVLVRSWGSASPMSQYLRITLPGNSAEFQLLAESLCKAIGSVVTGFDTANYIRGLSNANESQSNTSIGVNMSSARTGNVERSTNETTISASVNLDGTGKASVSTGIGFFDHMLTALAKHSKIDISLQCKGDLEVDDHHTVEDCALVIGQAVDNALGERRGIARFSSSYAPLDESLCRSVIDFSGRPFSSVSIDFRRDEIGSMATENVVHFFESFAVASRSTIHVDLIRGQNDHHKAEAAFKSFAIALRDAIKVDSSNMAIPSTKGAL